MKGKFKHSASAVMGMLPMKRAVKAVHMEMEQVETKIELWTQSNKFTAFIGFFIVLNAMALGFENDYAESWPTFFMVLGNVFTAVFALEVILRLIVEGCREYFSDKLNVLDFFLALAAVTKNWILEPMDINQHSNLDKMTVLRLLRLVRMLRLLKLLRMFDELKILVNAFIHCLRTLLWSFVFLLFVVYVFALCAVVLIGDAEKCSPPKIAGAAEQCEPEYVFSESTGTQKELFGTVARTTLTLFVCIVDGCGSSIVQPLATQNPPLTFFWVAFTLLTTFGLLNLIVGLVCEGAMAAATEDEKRSALEEEQYREKLVRDLRYIFKQMDSDGSETITFDEYVNAIKTNESCRELLINIGLGEDSNLFETLDADGTGELTFDEFFQGIDLLTKGREVCHAKDIVGLLLISQSVQRRIRKMRKHMVEKDDLERFEALQEKKFQRLEAMMGSCLSRGSPQMLIQEVEDKKGGPETNDRTMSVTSHSVKVPSAVKLPEHEENWKDQVGCIVKKVMLEVMSEFHGKTQPPSQQMEDSKSLTSNVQKIPMVDSRDGALEQNDGSLHLKESPLLAHVCHRNTPSEFLIEEEQNKSVLHREKLAATPQGKTSFDNRSGAIEQGVASVDHKVSHAISKLESLHEEVQRAWFPVLRHQQQLQAEKMLSGQCIAQPNNQVLRHQLRADQTPQSCGSDQIPHVCRSNNAGIQGSHDAGCLAMQDRCLAMQGTSLRSTASTADTTSAALMQSKAGSSIVEHGDDDFADGYRLRRTGLQESHDPQWNPCVAAWVASLQCPTDASLGPRQSNQGAAHNNLDHGEGQWIRSTQNNQRRAF